MTESKLTGPWKEIARGLKGADDAIRAGIKKATAKNAYMLEAALVLHLQNQDLKWPALNPLYKKWKERKKLSNQMLIATSTLMNSITTQFFDNGMGAFVGVLRQTAGKKRPGQSKAVKPVLLAAVHEFGIGVPARPLFAPTYAEKAKEIEENYIKAITKSIDEVMPK